MADTKQIDWGDGSGEKITVTASSFVGNKGLQIQSPENVKVTPRSKTIVLQSKTDPTKVARINVTQQKAVYTYDFTLNTSASMIGAEGGTTRVRGTLVTYRNGIQVSSETVVPTLSGSADGFSISGDVVTAANRGTTAGLVRRITVTGTYSDTFDGQEVSDTVVISQAANGITRVQISTGDGTSPITSFSAAGRSNWWYYAYGTYMSGSSARIPDSYSGWSLESVSWASIAPAEGATYAASFSCDSRGSEVGDARTVELSFTYNGKTASITITQAENKIECYNYGAWSISISANPTTIAYGGGTSTISASCTRSKTPVYSSGATGSGGSESATPALSGSATGFTLSGTTVTASSNSWAASRSITVTASYSGATSKSVTITQSAAPASISLNKTIIAFPQRASSNNVQVTCNSDWSVNSNDEFAVPETLQIKYNPSTDMVEIVDQPLQIIKKVQESDDYVLALVRIGAHQSAKNHSATKTISRDDIMNARNAAGYKNRNQMFLLSKQQDKSYHRIVPRQWFRNGDALSQIRLGASGGRGADGITPQAALFSLATLISKPGVKLGIRGCELSVPLVHVAKKTDGYVGPVNSVTWNKETGRLTLVCQDEPNADSVAQPRLAMVSCTSNNGPLGYILFKKKSTYAYLDVHGWEEISNFTLARILSNREFKVKQVGSTFEVIVTFQYGEV